MKYVWLAISLIMLGCGAESNSNDTAKGENQEPLPTATKPPEPQPKSNQTTTAAKVVAPSVTPSPEEQARLERINCLLGDKAACERMPPLVADSVAPVVVTTAPIALPTVYTSKKYRCIKDWTAYDQGQIQLSAVFTLNFKDGVLDEVTYAVGGDQNGSIDGVPLIPSNTVKYSSSVVGKAKLDNFYANTIGIKYENQGQINQKLIDGVFSYFTFDVSTHVLGIKYIVKDIRTAHVVLNTYTDSQQCVLVESL